MIEWLLIDPIIWVITAVAKLGSESSDLPLTDSPRAQDSKLLTAANHRYAYAIAKMADEDLARLPAYDVNLLAEAIYEGQHDLQLAALNALERIGNSEHLHSVNLLILKLRLASPHLAPQLERDEHAALLEAAEHCAKALHTRATFQRERDTLLRASSAETATSLLRPAANGDTGNDNALLRPTLIAAKAETEAPLSPVVNAHV